MLNNNNKKKKSVVNVYMLKVYFNNKVLPSRQLFVDIDNELSNGLYQYLVDTNNGRVSLRFYTAKVYNTQNMNYAVIRRCLLLSTAVKGWVKVCKLFGYCRDF